MFNTAGTPCSIAGKSIRIDVARQKCEAGAWSEIKPCSAAENKKIVCASSDACGECYEDGFVCTQEYGKYVQKQCRNGKWNTVKECGSFGCGTDNACASQKCTVEGGKKCQNDMNQAGTMLACKGDATDIVKCGAKSGEDFVPFSCSIADNSCGECLNGDKKKNRCIMFGRCLAWIYS